MRRQPLWVIIALAAHAATLAVPAGAAAGTQRAPLLPVSAAATTEPVEGADADAAPAGAAAAQHDDDDAFHSVDELTSMSLEELMEVSILNTRVTSVTRERTRVAEAPAAVHVITQDDIRRSGHTSIPELLRLAPGLSIARINANQWAISARGFNHVFHNRYADKLLVLQDGRPLYNPMSSGIYWESQDYLLQDIDRIEVVRGPGSTLWGANAVNGVINVVTKSARDTQGTLAHALAGTQESIGALRHGGRIDEETYYRVFAKYRDHYNFANPDGTDAHDGWDQFRGGFRIDRHVGDGDVFTLQGEGYEGQIGRTHDLDTLDLPFSVVSQDQFSINGADVIGRWTHSISPTSDFSLQMFYDRISRNDPVVGYEQDTFDVEFQHRFALTERQQIVWGVGARLMSDELENTQVIRVRDTSRQTYLLHAFVQDHVTIVPERLHLFVGSKFEVNPFTGLEVQPGVRGLWTPNETNTVWAAASRAVRTPNRLDDDADILFTRVGLPGSLVEVRGEHNNELKSEEVLALELGYRVEPVEHLSLDVATFYNRYDNLIGYVPTEPRLADPPLDLIFPRQARNVMAGETFGAEVAAHWRVSDRWRLSGSYSFIETRINNRGGVDASDATTIEDSAPRNQFQVHSYVNVTRDLELNAALYFVDEIGIHPNVGRGDLPEYARLDVNVAWRPREGLELTIGVQNLLDEAHPEFVPEAREHYSEVERMFYAQLVWKF
jgi:iron complex outermembrane recepter protein